MPSAVRHRSGRADALPRLSASAFLAIGVVLLLSACGGAGAKRPLAAAPANAALIDPGGAAAPVIALARPEAPPAIDAKTLPTPERMIGMAPDELIRMLGEPGFKRRDDPAEVWQYKGATCVLDVFLFRETEGARVSYVDVRGASIVKVAGEDCVLDVLKAKARADTAPG